MHWPRSWKGIVSVEQHQIVSASAYPARETVYKVLADHNEGIIRIEVLQGDLQGQVLIRDMNERQEMRIYLNHCEYARLLDKVPEPSLPLPSKARRYDEVSWVIEESETPTLNGIGMERVVVHEKEGVPDVLQVFSVSGPSEAKLLTTYRVREVDSPSLTDLNAVRSMMREWRQSCVKTVGGWPLVMLFHTYVRL